MVQPTTCRMSVSSASYHASHAAASRTIPFTSGSTRSIGAPASCRPTTYRATVARRWATSRSRSGGRSPEAAASPAAGRGHTSAARSAASRATAFVTTLATACRTARGSPSRTTARST